MSILNNILIGSDSKCYLRESVAQTVSISVKTTKLDIDDDKKTI